MPKTPSTLPTPQPTLTGRTKSAKRDPAPRDATSYILTYVTPTFTGERICDTPADVRDALAELRAEGLVFTFTVSRSTDDDITGEFQ